MYNNSNNYFSYSSIIIYFFGSWTHVTVFALCFCVFDVFLHTFSYFFLPFCVRSFFCLQYLSVCYVSSVTSILVRSIFTSRNQFDSVFLRPISFLSASSCPSSVSVDRLYYSLPHQFKHFCLLVQFFVWPKSYDPNFCYYYYPRKQN